ncbi:energy-coupling factor transporter transmembrane component T family protein [Isachenkonia alkalipeptolytica]|nr:energy-coupling factor transporter transmembrane component T [Isachenkonia alkalipeptolytica]
MHLAQIDRISNSTYSYFHKALVGSKVLFTVIMVTAFITSNTIAKGLGLLGVILLSFWIAKVPVRLVLQLALYPAFFSSIFALMEMGNSIPGGLLIIVRAVGAGMTMILLITTTPYTDLFSFLSLWMPMLLVDVFMFTYRGIFILIEKTTNLIKSMRLRGGYYSFNVFKNAKNMVGAIGVIIITSFDMSERMYQIYALRGYKGGIKSDVKLWPLGREDLLMILVGILAVIGVNVL